MRPTLSLSVPKVYQEFRDLWDNPDRCRACLEAYQRGDLSFVPNLLPEQAMRLSAGETMAILRGRWGELIDLALTPDCSDPDQVPGKIPPAIRGPVAGLPDTGWLKKANMVGVNVRTIGTFWNVVKYALTLPAGQDSIHILPIWEPGSAGSIYAMSSWQLNREYYSSELAEVAPWLDRAERQLRAIVNVLHVMGRTVGMDVIPHTDRFSEMALAYPEYFEWVRRQETIILDRSASLHEEVQDKIVEFLAAQGAASPGEATPRQRAELFDAAIPEERRLRVLFGPPEDSRGRVERRRQLIRWLYRYGYETVPATMAPPYRGLAVDPRPEARIVDDDGLVWRDYIVTKPEPMSRVFGPLARYKLYERVDDDASWKLDFSRPRTAVWQYVCEKYAEAQRRYGFDFMRGDMSHVQMRPEGVPATLDPYYDILGAVKTYVQRENNLPSFGYFAETFLAPRDVMGYGVEIDHLEAAEADTTLGDLQSTSVGSPEFLQRFRHYYDLTETRLCVPNFTVMTADKDDPRFDRFYLAGNEVRLFIALFLADMPSYMALGFETRDVHVEPAPNEHYTKLYVFHESSGPKATNGPYRWGRNGFLFSIITALRLYLDAIWPAIKRRRSRWLIPPDATAADKVIAWTQEGEAPAYVFVANTDPAYDAARFAIPHVTSGATLVCEFSTVSPVPELDRRLVFNGKHYPVRLLAAGEGRVYRVEDATR